MKKIIDLIMVPRCFFCKRFGSHVCMTCHQHLVAVDTEHSPHQAIYQYNPFCKKLIHAFKYNAAFWVISVFAPNWQKHIHQWQDVDMIIPIPITRQRLRQRGFHQSLIIAKKLQNNLPKKIFSDTLIHHKNTLQQKHLNREERLINLVSAFKINNHKNIENKKILLIDDVFTTGATIQAATQVLKENGAQEVFSLTLAKVMQENIK